MAALILILLYFFPTIIACSNRHRSYDEAVSHRIKMQSPPPRVPSVAQRTANPPIDPAKIPKAQYIRPTVCPSAYGEPESTSSTSKLSSEENPIMDNFPAAGARESKRPRQAESPRQSEHGRS
jgi:hypothetical protein